MGQPSCIADPLSVGNYHIQETWNSDASPPGQRGGLSHCGWQSQKFGSVGMPGWTGEYCMEPMINFCTYKVIESAAILEFYLLRSSTILSVRKWPDQDADQ